MRKRAPQIRALGGSDSVGIGIAADIHDSVDALKAILDRFAEMDVQKVVSLGDALETFKTGEAGAEVAGLLQQASAVGVWGNHDVGLSHNIPPEVCEMADPMLLEFTESLQPQLVIHNSRFSHVEPWLDPTIIEDLWHFDGEADKPDNAKRSLEAVPEQFLFIGHYHKWAITSVEGKVNWNAEETIALSFDQRYLILTAPVVYGWSAIFDTTTAELTPIRVPRDYSDRPAYFDYKLPPN